MAYSYSSKLMLTLETSYTYAFEAFEYTLLRIVSMSGLLPLIICFE